MIAFSFCCAFVHGLQLLPETTPKSQKTKKHGHQKNTNTSTSSSSSKPSVSKKSNSKHSTSNKRNPKKRQKTDSSEEFSDSDQEQNTFKGLPTSNQPVYSPGVFNFSSEFDQLFNSPSSAIPMFNPEFNQ